MRLSNFSYDRLNILWDRITHKKWSQGDWSIIKWGKLQKRLEIEFMRRRLLDDRL